MELVAHRAGNLPGTVREAAAVADAIEFDLHRFRGQLEVRHSKVIWPFRIYWERGVGLLPDERPWDVDVILDAAPDSAHLWVDLKGFTGRLTRHALREFSTRGHFTMSCRSWWALRPARLAGVRTFRSIGNRAQLWVALRLRHPDGVVMPIRFATPARVARLRELSGRVAVWGVEDRGQAEQLLTLGVAAVIVDDLGLIESLATGIG